MYDKSQWSIQVQLGCEMKNMKENIAKESGYLNVIEEIGALFFFFFFFLNFFTGFYFLFLFFFY